MVQPVSFFQPNHISLNKLNNIPPLTVHGQTLGYSSIVKNLGMTFVESLSWREHIKGVSGRVFGGLYQLKCLRGLPFSIKKLLVS